MARHSLNMPVPDGAAAAAFGGILAGVAVFLIGESGGWLVGEAVIQRSRWNAGSRPWRSFILHALTA